MRSARLSATTPPSSVTPARSKARWAKAGLMVPPLPSERVLGEQLAERVAHQLVELARKCPVHPREVSQQSARPTRGGRRRAAHGQGAGAPRCSTRAAQGSDSGGRSGAGSRSGSGTSCGGACTGGGPLARIARALRSLTASSGSASLRLDVHRLGELGRGELSDGDLRNRPFVASRGRLARVCAADEDDEDTRNRGQRHDHDRLELGEDRPHRHERDERGSDREPHGGGVKARSA